MSGQHAPLPPSSAYLWGPEGCPGAMQMQARQPLQEETEESREGDAAHDLLRDQMRKLPGREVADNGVPIDDEMREAVAVMVDWAFAGLAEWSAAKDQFNYENEVHAAAHNLIHPDNDGTPDYVAINWTRKIVRIGDFKYGHGFVDAYGNWQTVNYAAAVVETHQIPNWRDWTFELTICQPRNYHKDGPLRHWKLTGFELYGRVEALKRAAFAASEPDAPLQTGDHCKHCLAQWDCPANQQRGGYALDIVLSQGSSSMSPDALGLEGHLLDQAIRYLTDRKKALDVKISELLDCGFRVPYHAIEFGKPRDMWDKAKVEQAAQVVEMYGVPVVKGVALPTPRDCMKKGVDAAVIKPYVTTNAPAKKIVQVADNHAAKVFGTRVNSQRENT